MTLPDIVPSGIKHSLALSCQSLVSASRQWRDDRKQYPGSWRTCNELCRKLQRELDQQQFPKDRLVATLIEKIKVATSLFAGKQLDISGPNKRKIQREFAFIATLMRPFLGCIWAEQPLHLRRHLADEVSNSLFYINTHCVSWHREDVGIVDDRPARCPRHARAMGLRPVASKAQIPDPDQSSPMSSLAAEEAVLPELRTALAVFQVIHARWASASSGIVPSRRSRAAYLIAEIEKACEDMLGSPELLADEQANLVLAESIQQVTGFLEKSLNASSTDAKGDFCHRMEILKRQAE